MQRGDLVTVSLPGDERMKAVDRALLLVVGVI